MEKFDTANQKQEVIMLNKIEYPYLKSSVIEEESIKLLKSFNQKRNIGYKFTIENFNNGELVSKIRSEYVEYDAKNNKWIINKYKTRIFEENGEKIFSGSRIDTAINLKPYDFIKRKNLVETMNFFELNNYINEEEIKGSEQIVNHKIEKHKRIAFPFSAIILTLIAVAISSRKIRGGIGLHLGIGILIAFTYILFMQVSTTFATNSNLPAGISVWIPNIIYALLALILLKKAPK